MSLFELGLSYKEIAESIGVSDNTLTGWVSKTNYSKYPGVEQFRADIKNARDNGFILAQRLLKTATRREQEKVDAGEDLNPAAVSAAKQLTYTSMLLPHDINHRRVTIELKKEQIESIRLKNEIARQLLEEDTTDEARDEAYRKLDRLLGDITS